MELVVGWLLPGLALAVAAAVALWTAGAIYYDVGDRTGFRRPLALGWLVGVAALFALWRPVWWPLLALLAAFAAFLAWWLSLRPSRHRDWDRTVTRLPRAEVAGDVVRLHNVWQHHYRTFDDFTPNYVIRTVRLSHLRGADVLFFYWGSRWMSHPVLLFDFGPDGRVAFSAEVRFRRGQRYALLPGLYRQQELVLLVTDEYDAIARRVVFGTDTGYLYRLTAPADALRAVFLDYLAAVNRLHAAPRWYHGLCTNCTTAVARLPNVRLRWDWRLLANGLLDRALYDLGLLDRSLPFAALKRAAYLNDAAKAAPRDGFGEFIRAEIERAKEAEASRAA